MIRHPRCAVRREFTPDAAAARAQSVTRGAWHCIVGPDFGSFVTHEEHAFAYFYIQRPPPPLQQAQGNLDPSMVGILIYRT